VVDEKGSFVGSMFYKLLGRSFFLDYVYFRWYLEVMSITIHIQNEQLEDLSLLRDLGDDSLKAIIDSLSSLDFAIKPSDLELVLQKPFSGNPDKVAKFIRVLLSIVTLRRQCRLTVEQLLETLLENIIRLNAWSKEELDRWISKKGYFLILFELQNITTVAKALDLSYDYSFVLQNAKILTDIRPIFNADASSITGAVVAFVLRINYSTLEGKSDSISLSINEKDVNILFETCKRALIKAQTAKSFLVENNICATIIAGEED
jgi:hypothetical protein